MNHVTLVIGLCPQTRVVVIPLYISDYCEMCFPTNKILLKLATVKVKFDTPLLKNYYCKAGVVTMDSMVTMETMQ